MKKRIVSFLCVLFLLYTLCPSVSAAEPGGAETVVNMDGGFLLSVTDGEGIALARSEEGYLLMAEGNSAYTLRVDSYAEKTLILAVAGNRGVSTATLSFSEDGQDYRSAGTVSLALRATEATACYLVELPTDMAVSYIRIRLGGTPGAHLYLVSAEPPLVSASYRRDAVGTVSSASFISGNTLSVKGSLEAEASIRYLSHSLVLFALEPTDTLEDLTLDSPRLEELPAQQKFDFRVRLDDGMREKKYVVALVGEGEILPLTEPFYAYPTEEQKIGDVGYKGVYLDRRIDLFETGAETAVVEFDLNKLLRPEADYASTRLYMIDGVYYHLDTDYMNRIQQSVELANACGVATVLHLTGMSAAAEQYSSPVVLRAFVDFLCDQYGDAGAIRGVILDSQGLDMTSDEEGLAGYATMLHFLKLLTSTHLSGVTVYGEIDCAFDVSRSLCELSAALYKEGDLSYGVYFHTDTMSGTTVAELASLFSTENDAFPDVYGLLWDVRDNGSLELYGIYATQAEYSFDTFAVCLSEDMDAEAAFAPIRAFDADRRYVFAESMSEMPAEITGSYVLEEFDRNASAALWHTGEGVLSFGTGYSPLFARKVLTVHVRKDAHRALAVFAPSAPVDLSAAPYVCFSFAAMPESSEVLSAETPATVSGEIAFVSGTLRMILPLENVPMGEAIRVNFSLQEFEALSSIDAIVLSLEGETLDEVYIDSITVFSSTLTEEVLPAAILHVTDTDAEKNTGLPVVLFLGMLCLITIAVPFLLLRRSGESAEK